MTRRRRLLAGIGVFAAVVAVVAGVIWYRSMHRPTSDCDTVSSMIAYNKEFNSRTKESAGTDKAVPVGEQQYREWANRLKEYASRLSDKTLAGNAGAAADLAGRLADLVPKYRAKPDDPAVARDYAGVGIEFGNAFNRLEYACLQGL